MPRPDCRQAVVYSCQNCTRDPRALPRQWTQSGLHVQTKQIPCSGKLDMQYLLHAFEGGCDGVCIVTCPHGECTLSQGNYRAEVRAGTAKSLLAEAGIEPERVDVLHCSPDDPPGHLEQIVRAAVERFAALGRSPIGAER